MDRNEVDRRDVIGAAVLAAAVIGVPLAVLRSMRPSSDVVPTDRQRAVAGEVAQLLVPRTDTPGGADVGAHDFLILALAHGLDGTRVPASANAIQGDDAIYRRPDGTLDHLAWLEDTLDTRAGGDFLKAPLARRQAALDLIDRRAFANHRTSGPWPAIKGLLLTGYYTSEPGGAHELRYELVPGRFDPDVPQTPATRAFSSDWTAVEFG